MIEKYVYKINAIVETIKKVYVIENLIIKEPISKDDLIMKYVIGLLYDYIQTKKTTNELFFKIRELKIEWVDIEV